MRQHRIRADITQLWCGERIGYSPGAIAMVETGRWRPGTNYIRAFAAGMKLSLAEEQQILEARKVKWSRPRLKKQDRVVLALNDEDVDMRDVKAPAGLFSDAS